MLVAFFISIGILKKSAGKIVKLILSLSITSSLIPFAHKNSSR
ncbi:hypothetical protein [uncultured Dubosiella sp.]|jgi:hypothetical protein|nr:hypothetical protein [uncultured Dubosiella sp.]